MNIILNHGKDKDKLKAIELIYKNLGLLKDVMENTTTIKDDININTIKIKTEIIIPNPLLSESPSKAIIIPVIPNTNNIIKLAVSMAQSSQLQ